MLESDRHNNFDFIRFGLAALVIFSHSFDLLAGTSATNPFMVATHGQKELGTFAVEMFFIVSGFLITQSFLTGRGLRDFLKKRVLRIYPAFIMISVLCPPRRGAAGNVVLRFFP
jgi:peptidoglycan/LPS O-acetylase OafA/YrhL